MSRACLDCKATAGKWQVRCAPCKVARERKRKRVNLKRYYQTAKGRASKSKHNAIYRQRHGEKHLARQRGYNAKYYARLRGSVSRKAVVLHRYTDPTLAAINSLVPRGVPARDDICQNIALAILEGCTTADALAVDRKLLSAFIGKGRRENFERGGFAISLSQPRRDGRSWDDMLSADMVPA